MTIKSTGPLGLDADIKPEFPQQPYKGPIPAWTPPASIEYLVVAGGGGGADWSGGGANAGGGGAGGLLQGTLSSLTNTYSITVGRKGGNNVNGSNSTFAGLTAIGGGAGQGQGSGRANSGGSGGGAGQDGQPGSGTAGQGHDGGPSQHSNNYGSSGGGGAGGVGRGLGGGNGVQSSITGSPVWYACGGSGTNNADARDDATGWTDGGNFGHGGRGGRNGGSGRTDGSDGIVIVAYQGSPKYTGGSVDTTSRAGWTVHKFTSDGTLAQITMTAPDVTDPERPVSLGQFYAGGKRVPSGITGKNGPIPSSGPIKFSDFYGAAKFGIMNKAANIWQSILANQNVWWWQSTSNGAAATKQVQATEFKYPGYGELYGTVDEAGSTKSSSVGSNHMIQWDGNYGNRSGDPGNSGSDEFFYKPSEHPDLAGKVEKIIVRAWAGGGAGKDWRGNEALGRNSGGGGAYFEITDVDTINNGIRVLVGRGGQGRSDGRIPDSWGNGGSGGPTELYKVSDGAMIAKIAPGNGTGWGRAYDTNSFGSVALNPLHTNPVSGQGAHSEWGGGGPNRGTADYGGGTGGGHQGSTKQADDPAAAGGCFDGGGSARGGNGRVILTFVLKK